MPVEALLKATLPHDVVDALLDSYKEIEENFVLGKWKPSELDAGHFVEAVRRVIELRLMGSHTAIGTSLKPFSDQVLTSYENAAGDESYRLLIPRVLKSIYNIRNKRGVGHLSGFSPNEMDATLILYSAKWTLAELVRLESGLSIDETQAMVEQIVERRMELVWEDGDVVRIMDPSMKASDQVLLLLYKRSPQPVTDLLSATEYANSSRFRELLRGLHKERLVEYRGKEDSCKITPRGIVRAEAILSTV